MDKLKLTKLQLINYRSYPAYTLSSIGEVTILVGKNGVGKTNIIEALYLITNASHLRQSKISQLITWDKSEACVVADFSRGGRIINSKLSLKSGQRQFVVNNKKRTSKDIKGFASSLAFTPDDLRLVKGSQSEKRNSLDTFGGNISSAFYALKLDFEKLLLQKNRALKDGMDTMYLEGITDLFLSLSSHVSVKRLNLLQRIEVYAAQYYQEMSSGKEKLSIGYEVSPLIIDDEQENSKELDEAHIFQLLKQHYNQRKYDEFQKRRCLVGSHTDRINFYINYKNASLYASQGQQRSIVLAYKLAQIKLMEEILDYKPLVLLDDVMSELDESRRQLFSDLLGNEAQTFITTTNLDYFSPSFIDSSCVIALGDM